MSAELRPRIKIVTQLNKNEVIEKIKQKVEDPNTPCKGWAKEGYALICAPENDRHIWTPQLNLQIDETEEGTEVRGVIGPSANIWTAFAFTFSILGFITFVALFWGLSRLSLDYSADILWVVPIALLIIFGVYMLARIGQQLSRNEVKQLKEFVETTLQK
ncbi:MAG: hypothetical protein KDC88_04830 [Ignavibacteriae bacterium]|nr:hypothetical protein [Ignavibacteriota bacterium]MCB9208568.1 hypothetical protein [Ignavibacteriales bacterium]MCB9258322.1 hypothetical protein [Ignavibacteriales bacterium]